MPDRPRPTKAWILAEYTFRQNHYRNMHTRQQLVEKFRWNDYADQLKGMPKGYTARMTSTAPAAVQVLADHILLGEKPDVAMHIPQGLHRDKKLQLEHQEKLRLAADHLLYNMEMRTTETPLRDFVMKGGGLGLGGLTYVLNYDAIPEKVVRKKGETKAKYDKRKAQYDTDCEAAWPLDVRSAHPLNLYLDPAHDPPWDVIEVRPKGMRQMSEVYPHLQGTKPLGEKRPGFEDHAIEVEELIYISKDWYAIYANGVNMLTEDDEADDDGVAPNPMGFVPYAFAWGGFGEIDRYNRPEYRGVGILHLNLDVLCVEAEAFNQANSLRAWAGFGTWGVEHDQGPDAAVEYLSKYPLTVGPNVITPLGPEVRLKEIPPPGVPPAVWDTLKLVQQYSEIAFGSTVLRGVTDASSPASKTRTMVQEARLMFGALKKSCEQAVEKLITDIFTMVRDATDADGEPLFANGFTLWVTAKGKEDRLTLYPEEIPHGFTCKVKFMPPTAEEKAFRLQEGLQMMTPRPDGSTLISETRFLTEYTDVADPLTEIKEKAKDKIRRALVESATQIAIALQTQQLQQKLPGLIMPVPQPGSPVMSGGGGAQPIAPGPNGLTPPGEPPVAPPLGGPQDQVRQAGGPRPMAPQTAGVM